MALDLRDGEAMRVALLSAAMITAALVGCAGGAENGDIAAGDADLSVVKLSVEESTSLPLNEISGLGVRTVAGKPQYLAVGDSSKVLLTFGLDESGRPTEVKKNDLKPMFPGGGDSQWEAVAGDGAGNVFIMSEGEAAISVLGPDLTLRHIIHLEVPEDSPLFTTWDRDENSRGEGMVLLGNGHILVAKEKGPSAIMELAPAGEAAQGYAPGLGLQGAFKIPRGETSDYVVVKSWELKAVAARFIGDISDLTIGSDGSLVVLSDQSRSIARIERELSVEEDRIDLKQVWDLPREVDKPEGLQLVDGAPIVACDLPQASAKSFFRVSPL